MDSSPRNKTKHILIFSCPFFFFFPGKRTWSCLFVFLSEMGSHWVALQGPLFLNNKQQTFSPRIQNFIISSAHSFLNQVFVFTHFIPLADDGQQATLNAKMLLMPSGAGGAWLEGQGGDHETSFSFAHRTG